MKKVHGNKNPIWVRNPITEKIDYNAKGKTIGIRNPITGKEMIRIKKKNHPFYIEV